MTSDIDYQKVYNETIRLIQSGEIKPNIGDLARHFRLQYQVYYREMNKIDAGFSVKQLKELVTRVLSLVVWVT